MQHVQHRKRHGIPGETAMVSTASMVATMFILEQVKSPMARVFALALVGAATAAGRELLYQGKWVDGIGEDRSGRER